MPIGSRLCADVINLGFNAFRGIAISEVPIRHSGRHITRSTRATALKNFRVRQTQRFGLKAVVINPVKIPFKREVVLRPNALEHANELLGATIALIVFQPMFTDSIKLAPKPTADDIDRNTPLGQLIDRRQLLGSQRGLPWAGQNGRNHFQARRRGQ